MRLLFVEDEPDLREVLKKQLQGSGYSVDACGDGLEALDYLQLTAYDAVILDIMLPGVDGLSVLKKMRTAGDKTPVLLLTARGSVEDRVAGLDLGADDYLVGGAFTGAAAPQQWTGVERAAVRWSGNGSEQTLRQQRRARIAAFR